MGKPKNRILQLRKAAKLTQSRLAELAGTSQQQIQRIETSASTVRLDVAQRIAAALDAGLTEVFPALIPHRRKSGVASTKALEEADIDPDPKHWCMRVYTFDGRLFDFQIASREKKRLESIIGTRKQFLVFDSHEKCVAVNNRKLAACQFLWDAFVPDERAKESDGLSLTLHLIASKEPFRFSVEPDSADVINDDIGLESQLQRMFLSLDGDDEPVVYFDDGDAERVYINTDEILLLEVPLVCCQPDLWNNVVEFEDEIEHAAIGVGKK